VSLVSSFLALQTQWNVKEALPSAPLRYFTYMPLMHSEQLQDQQVGRQLASMMLCWFRVRCKPACWNINSLCWCMSGGHTHLRATHDVCSPGAGRIKTVGVHTHLVGS
jgi:hypothetical protein